MNWSFLLWSLMTCLSVNISFGLYFQMGLGQRSDDQTEIKHLLSRNSAAISELVCRDRLS